MLVIDIGNTNIVAGLFRGEDLVNTGRLPTPQKIQVEFAVAWLKQVAGNADQDGAVLGSVVPDLTEPFVQALTDLVGQPPLVVSARIDLPISIDINLPDQVGADRIANATAGFIQYGGPVTIVDFGTATTFDIVSKAGAYIGGVIIPGPKTAMADLARRAARLFEVPIVRPEKVIGRSTEAALQSGFYYGTVGQVDYILRQIIAESGEAGHTIIATGGLAGTIAERSQLIQQVDANITLSGLRYVALHNHRS